MGTCEHKEIENIDSKYTVDNCNLITQQCKKCKMKRYVHKGKNIHTSSKWFKLK